MGTIIPYPPFQRVPTTSMLPSQLLAIIGFFLMGSVHTFARDLSSSFFTHRFFPSTTFPTSGSRQLRRAFVPDSLSFPLGSASQPSWQVAEMGTMYRKRASSPKKAPTREQACQGEGDLSLFKRVAWRRRQTALLSHHELCLHWQEVPMRS